MNNIRFAQPYDYHNQFRHIRGEVHCPQCIGGTVLSKCICGGLIHIACVATETSETGLTMVIQTRCDMCGTEFVNEN